MRIYQPFIILFFVFILSSCATSDRWIQDYHRTGINSIYTVEKDNDAVFVTSINSLPDPVIEMENDLSLYSEDFSTVISTNNLRIISNHHEFEMVDLLIDYNDDDYLSNRYELFLILSTGSPNKKSRVINEDGIYRVFYRFAYCFIGNILEGAYIDVESTKNVIQSDYKDLQKHGVSSISMQQHIKLFDALMDETKVEKINTETSKEQAMVSFCGR